MRKIAILGILGILLASCASTDKVIHETFNFNFKFPEPSEKATYNEIIYVSPTSQTVPKITEPTDNSLGQDILSVGPIVERGAILEPGSRLTITPKDYSKKGVWYLTFSFLSKSDLQEVAEYLHVHLYDKPLIRMHSNRYYVFTGQPANSELGIFPVNIGNFKKNQKNFVIIRIDYDNNKTSYYARGSTEDENIANSEMGLLTFNGDPAVGPVGLDYYEDGLSFITGPESEIIIDSVKMTRRELFRLQ